MTFQLLIWVLIFGAFVELLDIIFPAEPPEWWDKDRPSPDTSRANPDLSANDTRRSGRMMAPRKD